MFAFFRADRLHTQPGAAPVGAEWRPPAGDKPDGTAFASQETVPAEKIFVDAA